MNIHDEAISAGVQALDKHYGVTTTDPDCIRELRTDVIAILSGASPFIAEQSLRDASREYRAREAEDFSGDRVARLLNARADEQVNP